MENATEVITEIKDELKLKKWSEEIRSCSESGMTVLNWCNENGIKPKTYYYHLRKVRESLCGIKPVKQSVVPISVSDSENTRIDNTIVITGSNFTMKLPSCINSETLLMILKELKTC